MKLINPNILCPPFGEEQGGGPAGMCIPVFYKANKNNE